MKLKEFEGKQLLEMSKIKIPKSVLIKKSENFSIHLLEGLSDNVVLKAQVFSNGRGKNGGILFATKDEVQSKLQELFSKTVCDEIVDEVLIEDQSQIDNEYFLGIMFDTQKKCPIIMLSSQGGVDIEEIPKDKIVNYEINVNEQFMPHHAREIATLAGFSGKTINKLSVEICRLYSCFKKNDMKMIEVNPLILEKENSEGKQNILALDCVCVLDEDALKRHSFTFPRRTDTKEKTEMELRANKIDEDDHRGVCGKTFIELDGDIGILSSGGGASVTAIDAVLLSGGNPANFTEYSGNPPAEKVSRLARIVLEKEGLKGLFIVGGRANFTRIDITLKAIIDVVVDLDFKYPILIRRAGPGYEDAFLYIKEMIEKHNLNIHLYDDSEPISRAAQKMVELVEEVKE